jgi:hypothetical protein
MVLVEKSSLTQIGDVVQLTSVASSPTVSGLSTSSSHGAPPDAVGEGGALQRACPGEMLQVDGVGLEEPPT